MLPGDEGTPGDPTKLQEPSDSVTTTGWSKVAAPPPLAPTATHVVWTHES